MEVLANKTFGGACDRESETRKHKWSVRSALIRGPDRTSRYYESYQDQPESSKQGQALRDLRRRPQVFARRRWPSYLWKTTFSRASSRVHLSRARRRGLSVCTLSSRR